MKSLKPSQKENKRYLLVETSSGSENEIEDIKKETEKAIFDFIGVLGFSKLGLKWIKYSNGSIGSGKNKKKQAIFAVNRQAVDRVRASLVIWPKRLDVIRVSGTLKSLREKTGLKV